MVLKNKLVFAALLAFGIVAFQFAMPVAADYQPAVTCYSHAYQKCIGNSVYWFDSCNNQQDLNQICAYNQICQGNACVLSNSINYNNNPTYQNNTQTTYQAHFLRACFNNQVYWYDNYGNKTDVYQNCNLTQQACSNGACVAQATTPAPKPAPTPTTSPKPTVTTPKPSTSPTVTPPTTTNQDQNQNVDQPTANQDQVTNNDTTAAVSNNPIFDFIGKWYAWIIALVILIVIFIVVFMRASSNG